MKHSIKSLVIAALLASASVAYAQESEGEAEGQEGNALPPLGVAVTEAFNKAIEFMDMNELAQAREVITELDPRRMSPFEIGRAEQILANIAYAEGNYPLMREHLNKALASGGLSAPEVEKIKFQIAQLFLGEEMYKEAAAAFEEWFPLVTDPNPIAYYFLAVSYYYMMPPNYDKALENARIAVESTDEPQEGWLSLLIALLIDPFEDYEEARDQLERIVALAPHKKNYWLQLSSVHSFMDNQEAALAAMEIPYLAGMLDTSTEVRRYAELLLYNQIGYRCGRVLEKGIADGLIEEDLSTYQKLSDCWLQAGELDEAAVTLDRAAAMSDTGKEYVRLGEVNIRRERYDEAARAFQNALDKGGIDDVDRVELLMGVVIYSGTSPCGSREWFERARSSDQHRANANGYIQLLDLKEECRR